MKDVAPPRREDAIALLGELAASLALGAWGSSVAFDAVSRSANETMWARGAMWLQILGLAAAIVGLIVGSLPGSRRTGATAAVAAIVFAAGSIAVRRSSLDDLIEGTPWLAIALAALGFVSAVAHAAANHHGPTGGDRISEPPPVPSAVGGARGRDATEGGGDERPLHPAIAATRRRRARQAADLAGDDQDRVDHGGDDEAGADQKSV